MLITMITAPRPGGINYLKETLPLWQQQCEPVIFRDGAGKGSRALMRQVFTWFIKQRLDSDRLLYLEDDVLPCQNLCAYAAHLPIPPGWPLVTLFEPRVAATEPRLLAMNVAAFQYTQALLLPRSTVEGLLTLDFSPARATRNGCSIMLRQHLLTLSFKEYGAHLPSLVQHIGEQSAALSSPTRVPGNPTFPGLDFCALTLQ